MFKDYILYLYLAQGQAWADNAGGGRGRGGGGGRGVGGGCKILILTKKVYYFDHTLQVSAISLKYISKNNNFQLFPPIQMYGGTNLST